MIKTAIGKITSKRQLTIPASMFLDSGFKANQRVLIEQEENSLRVTPALSLVEELAGSVKIPARFKAKPVDKIVEMAKREYFAKRYKVLKK